MTTSKHLPANTEVVFGTLAPPLHEQLGGSEADWEHEQLDANALVRLKVRGYISRSALQTAEKRLVKRIGEKLSSRT